jgi:hypothetical protein
VETCWCSSLVPRRSAAWRSGLTICAGAGLAVLPLHGSMPRAGAGPGDGSEPAGSAKGRARDIGRGNQSDHRRGPRGRRLGVDAGPAVLAEGGDDTPRDHTRDPCLRGSAAWPGRAYRAGALPPPLDGGTTVAAAGAGAAGDPLQRPRFAGARAVRLGHPRSARAGLARSATGGSVRSCGGAARGAGSDSRDDHHRTRAGDCRARHPPTARAPDRDGSRAGPGKPGLRVGGAVGGAGSDPPRTGRRATPI